MIHKILCQHQPQIGTRTGHLTCLLCWRRCLRRLARRGLLVRPSLPYQHPPPDAASTAPPSEASTARTGIKPVSKLSSLISTSRFLRLNPEIVTFKDVQPGTQYVTEVEARNVSKYLRRIRIIPPSDKCFQIEYSPTQPIACGFDNHYPCEVLYH